MLPMRSNCFFAISMGLFPKYIFLSLVFTNNHYGDIPRVPLCIEPSRRTSLLGLFYYSRTCVYRIITRNYSGIKISHLLLHNIIDRRLEGSSPPLLVIRCGCLLIFLHSQMYPDNLLSLKSYQKDQYLRLHAYLSPHKPNSHLHSA